MQVFLTTNLPVKTKEQLKITRISNRIPTAVRKSRKSGPVTIIIARPE